MKTDWTLIRTSKELPDLLKVLGDFQASEEDIKVFSCLSNVLHPHNKKKKMKDALTRSGLTDYLSEFFPASYDRDLTRFEMKFDSMLDPNYPQFLNQIIANKYVVPDTNILIDRVLTKRMLNNIGHNKAIQVRLSRISILELEALYKIKNKQPISKSGFCEVRILSGYGAKFLMPLPWDVIIEYAEKLRTGKKGARLVGDPGIRKEILDYVIDKRDRAALGGKMALGPDRVDDISPSQVVLLTSDFAFALASFGEDISCLYLYKKGYRKNKVNYNQLASFVHEYAISTKNILVLTGTNSKIEIMGFWPEKTFYDLLQERIRYRMFSLN